MDTLILTSNGIDNLSLCFHKDDGYSSMGRSSRNRTGPEVIKNHALTVGILKFMSRKNSILGLSEPEKC